MGQTARTTKLLLDLSPRAQGGTNTGKRHALEETVALLNAARRFYLDFFLAHPDQLREQVEVLSSQTGALTHQLISADKLLTWAEFHTVATEIHPAPLPAWNFSQAFPAFPNRYRRSVIKDCLGKARGSSFRARALGTLRPTQRQARPPHSSQSPDALCRDLHAGTGDAGPAPELRTPEGVHRDGVGLGQLSHPLQPLL